LLSGALQFGRRWNTVSSPTLSAISPITWMPVAPVPMTATACRPCRPARAASKGVERAALETVHALERGRVGIDSSPTVMITNRQVSSRPSSIF
jgi:hypothetical protein